MANDIAAFFASEPDREVAIDAIATHLRRYWAPRMRAQLRAHAEGGGEGLGDLALAAASRLAPANQRND
ncbi:MAG: formate dehydrogenase subunit delta [Lysobacteraceae bacterium]|nr:MAG: formate dehydrogenase subunit delta [Xanthomonadaceae bacterium]